MDMSNYNKVAPPIESGDIISVFLFSHTKVLTLRIWTLSVPASDELGFLEDTWWMIFFLGIAQILIGGERHSRKKIILFISGWSWEICCASQVEISSNAVEAHWKFNKNATSRHFLLQSARLYRSYLFSVTQQHNYIVPVSALDSVQLQDEYLSQRL